MTQGIQHFQDVHLHASAVQQWRQTYSQITSGAFESVLLQSTSPNCHIFRERIQQGVVQHGEAPQGKYCFAIPLAVPGAARMQGREADNNCLFFLHGGEEFFFHMPKGMDLLAITFGQELFETVIDQMDEVEKIRTLLRQPVIRIPQQHLMECRQWLQVMAVAALNGGFGNASALAQGLEVVVLEQLLLLMSTPDCDARQRWGRSTHSFIVEKCHRLALVESAVAPNVNHLSRHLRVSRRTVQNSFRSVAGTTPLQYLRSIRLNGVRQELMSTPARTLSVGDAAARWGFFHLSHFTEAYKHLFGELPSQTRRATIAA